VFVVEPVAADVDDRCEGDSDVAVGWWDVGDSEVGPLLAWGGDLWWEEGEGGRDGQPVYFFVVGEAEYEFVYDTVDADCSTDEIQFCVFGVVEYEMVSVECCKGFSANSSSHLCTIKKQSDVREYGSQERYESK
jgi:hypothetical protein